MDYSCLQSKYLTVPAVKYFDCYIKIDGSNFSFIKSKFKYKLNMNRQILIKWPWCFCLGFINRWTCNMKIIQFSFNNSDSQTIMTSTFFLTRTPHIFSRRYHHHFKCFQLEIKQIWQWLFFHTQIHLFVDFLNRDMSKFD